MMSKLYSLLYIYSLVLMKDYRLSVYNDRNGSHNHRNQDSGSRIEEIKRKYATPSRRKRFEDTDPS